MNKEQMNREQMNREQGTDEQGRKSGVRTINPLSMLIARNLDQEIRASITDYDQSQLKKLVTNHGNFVIKFVNSQWAEHYVTANPLKISVTPALTWGTATYVTPLAFPLSSALYGRIGLVTEYDPVGWRIFDATNPHIRALYVKWVRTQPAFQKLVTTVHATIANHEFRNQFRKHFAIDCVLFHPDQEAEYYTHSAQHIWMAVTDWAANKVIDGSFSARLSKAKFTVLIDEDFVLKEKDSDLPVGISPRQIEYATQSLQNIRKTNPLNISAVRGYTSLSGDIADRYQNGGYLHIYIEP